MDLPEEGEPLIRPHVRGIDPTRRSAALPSYIPQFDGLRGIAILAVMATHLEALRQLGLGPLVEYGRMGVDLFFVLSGFLITGILLDSQDSPHYFRNFYARRALRIWPLYFSVLFVYLVLLPRVRPEAVSPMTRHSWPYLVLYIQNWLPHLALPAGLVPTWSLAIEEQFYMAWPSVARFARGRALPALLIVLVAITISVRFILHYYGVPMEFNHHFTLCRLDAISFGSLAAWWLRSPSYTYLRWRRASVYSLFGGSAGILVAKAIWRTQSSLLSYVFVAAVFAGLLGVALFSREDQWLGRALRQRWLRYVGKISYGLYLFHISIYLAVGSFFSRQAPIMQTSRIGWFGIAITSIAAVFGLASLSWYFFESQLLRLKRFFQRGS